MTEANHALLTRRGKAPQKVNSRALSKAEVPTALSRLISDQAAGKCKSKCWPWIGSYSHNGYGRWVGNVNNKSKAFVVHRAAYAMFLGDVPAGLIVRHTCDCPPCFNPEHLVVCTQLENMHDKAAKGRSMWSNTTSEQRIAMMKLAHKRSTDSRGRAVIAPDGRTWPNSKAAADDLGMHRSKVYSMVRRKTDGWRYVDEEYLCDAQPQQNP